MTQALSILDMGRETVGDRQLLVGEIVREAIQVSGLTFSQTARSWPISLPTLNRLMITGNVGQKFYRIAEKNLGLPFRLLDLVVDGDVDAIRAMSGLDEYLRDWIIRELDDGPPAPNHGRNMSAV